MLYIHYEEQLQTYTIKFMTEMLRTSKRESEPLTHGVASSGKVKAKGAIPDPKYQGLCSGSGRTPTEIIIALVPCLCPLKHAGEENNNPENLLVQVRRNAFAGTG